MNNYIYCLLKMSKTKGKKVGMQITLKVLILTEKKKIFPINRKKVYNL